MPSRGTSRPTPTSPWPGRCSPRWCCPGSPSSGSSTTSTTTSDGRPYADPNAMGEALIEAARDAGLRLTLLDTCYLAGGLAGDGHVPLDDVQRRFTDGDVDAWATRVAALTPTPTTRIGAAVHSVRAVPRDDLRAMAEVTRGRTVHAHVSEQPAENLATQMFYGATPTELLDEAGLLGRAVQRRARDAPVRPRHQPARASRGTTACFCPTTERDLADGIGPARALAEAGARLSLGSDQHAVIDPFEEVRGLEMHERLASNERGRFTPDELLDGRHRRRLPQPRLAGRRRSSPTGRRRTSSSSAPTPSTRRAPRRARSSTAQRDPTSTGWSSAAAPSWRRAATGWATWRAARQGARPTCREHQ